MRISDWSSDVCSSDLHGIGRLDIVENRYVGMKSRGCYETPGGTILLKAHRAIESLCLDREQAHLKDEVMPKYASLIYNGYRSEEHTSELQSLMRISYAVFCLKKKKKTSNKTNTKTIVRQNKTRKTIHQK